MTSTIAFTGKSGSGKTTLAKAFLKLLKKSFPQNSILLIDNDLTLELSNSFENKTRNTIYGIKSGKHEYKTGIPEGMSKQEFIEWALEDIIVEVQENVDLITSWFVTPKDCKCPSAKLMRDSLVKLVERYDFVIFDCEYDLKYLNLLLEYPIDETIIVSKTSREDVLLASKIADSSRKYAAEGQLGVVLNEADKSNIAPAIELLNELELNFLGAIEKTQDKNDIVHALGVIYSRMNLPQINN